MTPKIHFDPVSSSWSHICRTTALFCAKTLRYLTRSQNNIALAWGAGGGWGGAHFHRRPKTHLKSHVGFRNEAPKDGLRKHLCVSRRMLRKDISRSEDMWASEDTFSEHCPGRDTSQSEATYASEDICRRLVGQKHVMSRRHRGA